MEKKIILSIIIPYYNTLQNTLILLQQLRRQITNSNVNIEIIVVNDGSNGLLLKKYCDNYIDLKENKGVAHARNEGLKQAQGEFITFIDSDDEVYDNYIEIILNKIINSSFDLCWLSWNSLYGPAIVNNIKQINKAVWGCIFNKKIIKNVYFDENYNVNEELSFWS